MIEFKTEKEVMIFDGGVIHKYRGDGMSLHLHIDFVESVKIVSDKNGENFIQINTKEDLYKKGVGHWPNRKVSPPDLAQAKAFVDAVMQAIGSR
jgi:hypothetical protein